VLLLNRLQLLGRICGRIHLGVGLGDLPFFVDHVGDTAGVFVLFGLTGPVGQADRVVRVAEEGEGEFVFFGESLVLGLGVETDAEDLRVLRFVLGLEVPEPGTFARSAGCVGLRVEPEDDFLAPQIAEADDVAVVIGGLEIGSSLARLEHARLPTGHGSDDAANRHAAILRKECASTNGMIAIARAMSSTSRRHGSSPASPQR
jgi:hypothetical protein